MSHKMTAQDWNDEYFSALKREADLIATIEIDKQIYIHMVEELVRTQAERVAALKVQRGELLATLGEIADMAHAGFCDCDCNIQPTNEKAHTVSCPVAIEAVARAMIAKER